MRQEDVKGTVRHHSPDPPFPFFRQYGSCDVRPAYSSACERLERYRVTSKAGGVGMVGKGCSGRLLRRTVRLSWVRVTLRSCSARWLAWP
ncbi:hypothetical protein IG631_19585 [Alternaria alternata]|nr:hypothetical protein IG631_19585 [Alternaria alternata]